jgi:hypothetical protein
MKKQTGLTRDLVKGDAVIPSTGATASVRRSYLAGYTGAVEMLLDGEQETERASGLTLLDEVAPKVGSNEGEANATHPVEIGETRAPSRRMED